MRLSEWRARAPTKDSVSPKVIGRRRVGARRRSAPSADPECWIVWGDDPASATSSSSPIASGLVQVNVRVNVPGEGPRAAGKVIRWNRVQLGELAVEIQGGHRLVTFQAEAQVLSGVDDMADAIAAFAQALFAAIDGRAGSFADRRRAPTPGEGEPAQGAGRRPAKAVARRPASKGS